MKRLLLALLLIMTIVSAYSCDADTLGWWTLNETGGTSYRNACNGTLATNYTSYVTTGVFSNAADFETTDSSYIDTNLNDDVNGNSTVTAWFKPESLTARGGIIGQLDAGGGTAKMSLGLEFYDTNNSIRCWSSDAAAGGTAIYSSNAVTAGNWYFISCTYMDNGTGACIEVNGTRACVAGAQAPANSGVYNWSIGRLGEFDGLYADGIIDEVSIWDRALLGHFGDAGTEVDNIAKYNDINGGGGSSIWNYTILSSTYTTPVYETTNTSYYTAVSTNTSHVTDVNAIVNWNGTNYTATSSGSSNITDNKTYWFNKTSFKIPLVETNDTNITEKWYYNITYTNGTVAHKEGTSNTQHIYHYFYWGTYTPDTSVIENHPLTFTSNFTESASGIVTAIWADFNNTNYALTGSGGNYAATTTAPNVTGTSQAFNSNSTFTVQFTGDYGGARTYDRISANTTITVYHPSLMNCSAGGTNVLNFTFLTETNQTTLTSDMDATFTWWTYANHTGIEYESNFSWSDVDSVSICISPNSTLYVDSFQTYTDNGTTYRYRNYFLTNASMSPSNPSSLNLFNIPIADSDLLTLTVEDNLVEQPNVYVIMERYYPGENTYRKVEIGKTDADGQTLLYPVPNDVYYRFIVIKDYEIVYSDAPREISTSTITLDITESSQLEYYQYENNMQVSCSKTGDIIGCSVVNPTGLAVGAQFLVKEQGIYTDTEICFAEETTVSSTTFTCNISGYSGIVQANLMFIAPESLISAWSETYNGSATNIFEGFGLWLSLLLIVGSAMLLASTPSMALIGAIIGLLISAILGIWALSITSVIVIVVAAGFLFVRMRQ